MGAYNHPTVGPCGLDGGCRREVVVGVRWSVTAMALYSCRGGSRARRGGSRARCNVHRSKPLRRQVASVSGVDCAASGGLGGAVAVVEDPRCCSGRQKGRGLQKGRDWPTRSSGGVHTASGENVHCIEAASLEWGRYRCQNESAFYWNVIYSGFGVGVGMGVFMGVVMGVVMGVWSVWV